MRKPYLIRTPSFSSVSGGIRVMYGLYAWLLVKGELAYLNSQIDTPSVGIYPEIYHGNDMNASKVIRYVLQTPAVMGTTDGTGTFEVGPTSQEIKDTSDDIYVFSKIYDTFGVDEDHILFLPIINLNLFINQKKPRTKTAFYVGKGVNKGKHPDEAVELTREFAKDQQALADFLNECQTLYIYDRLSAIMDIARLCGCSVRYYGEFTEKELKKYETGMNGLTYGDDKEPQRTFSPNEFRYSYEELIFTFSRKLDKFIQTTQ